MARAAPSADRTVALLDFLAAHPDERFGLSDLARRLDINKATAHALTAALTNAGYLLRHPVDKRYSLGPALIAIGNAAASRQSQTPSSIEFAPSSPEGTAWLWTSTNAFTVSTSRYRRGRAGERTTTDME